MLTITRNNVAITPIYNPDKTPGGLWIPDQAKDRCVQGIVKYLSSKAQEESGLSIGDWVLFSAYDGQLTYIEDEGQLIILDADRVTAILSEEGEETLPMHGLYFNTRDGDYIPATYEQVLELIAQNFQRLSMKVKVKNKIDTRAKPEYLKS